MSRCNGCTKEQLKKKHGKKMIKVGGTYYLKGEQPVPGQGEPMALEDGTPIRFLVWFMAEGHDHSESQADIDAGRFDDESYQW